MNRNRTTSDLTSLGYPSIGISQESSLEPRVILGPNCEWNLTLKPGHYYDLDGIEKRLFISASTLTSALVSGSNTVTLTESLNGYNSDLEVFGSAYQYVPVLNYLRAAQNLSWTEVSSGIWESTLSSGTSILGARGLYWDLYPVPRVQDLDSYSYYVSGLTVQVKSETTPASSLFFDISQTSSTLLISELLRITEGYVYPTYYHRYNTTLVRGSSSQSYSGLSSGTITSPFSGEDGQWVRAEYYVPFSWTLGTQSNQILVFTSAASDTVRVEWESANSLSLAMPEVSIAAGRANFNPLLPNSFRTGYLFHHSTSGSLADSRTTNTINITSSKTSICSGWEEEVSVRVQVLYKNLLPIPQKDVTILLTNSAGTSSFSSSLITYAYPSSTLTDLKGEMLISLAPTQTTRVWAISDSVSASVLIDVSNPVDNAKVHSGSVLLLGVKDLGAENAPVLYTSGIAGYGYPKSQTIQLKCDSDSKFIIPDVSRIEYNNSISVTTTREVSNIFALSDKISVSSTTDSKVIANSSTSLSKEVLIKYGQ